MVKNYGKQIIGVTLSLAIVFFSAFSAQSALAMNYRGSSNNPISKPLSSPISKPLSSPISKPLSSPISKPLSSPISKPLSSPISKPLSSPSTGEGTEEFSTGSKNVQVARCITINNGIKVKTTNDSKYYTVLNNGVRKYKQISMKYTYSCLSSTEYNVDWIVSVK